MVERRKRSPRPVESTKQDRISGLYSIAAAKARRLAAGSVQALVPGPIFDSMTRFCGR